MVKIKQQRGIALITVILIVTLITIATYSMTAHQQLDIRRTVNSLNHSQALVYLRGAEYLSMTVLKEDLKKNKIDTLDEDWATVLPPFPVDGGTIGGVLEDLSGKFNINNLVDTKGKISKIDYKRFQNLLVNLKLDVEIADAVVDWIDKGDTPLPGGAEEGFYLSKDKQAYRTPNRLIFSTTELLRVKGINFKVYKKLKPHITALQERNKINVNTAGKEVLRMIATQVTSANAEELIKGRDKKGYKTIGEFNQQPAFAGLDKKELVDLDIKTSYFLLTSTAIIGQLEIRMKSILKRDDKKRTVVVTVRSQGGL
jgi:general secretion pathway protein K